MVELKKMTSVTGAVVKKYLSEFAGTFGFVFIGCGAVVFAAPFIGYLGIALAFGAAYGAMNFTFSGSHLNPAVTVAAAVCGRMRGKNVWLTLAETAGFILMQTAGACAAVALIYFVYSGKNGYVYQGSPDANIAGRYALSAVFWLEVVLNFLFVCVFLGTDEHKGRQPAACALFICAAYLLSYPVTKGAMNPARTVASALFAESDAVAQLPVFCGAAFAAAVAAGLLHLPFFKRAKDISAS